MTHAPIPPDRDEPSLPSGLAASLRALREDVAPARDPWPAIAARLGARERTLPAPSDAWTGEPAADRALDPAAARPAAVPADPRPAARRDWRRHLRRRDAGYAAAAAVVLAVAVAWQLSPVRIADAPGGGPVTGATGVADDADDADVPLLRSADALAREYQAALHEVRAARSGIRQAATAAATPGLDAELERSAAEVRAALARDPGAVHLFHQLQRIYAHRLALNLRQA